MTRRAILRQAVAGSLIDRVPPEHTESDRQFVRRRIVVGAVPVLGAVLLAACFAVRAGDPVFYLLTTAVAVTWVAGGLLSGPLQLGYRPVRGRLRRPVLAPVVIGLAAGAVFLAGALAVRQIPPLRDYVDRVLAHARYGSMVATTTVTVANGVAEEVFFRGALFAAIGRRYPVVLTTVGYTITTVATGNPMLVFGALTLGFLLALQRRATGGILAPILTHVTWSVLMLYLLPPLFAHRSGIVDPIQ
jgi:membrane protease YdiL (CAAX protease family)